MNSKGFVALQSEFESLAKKLNEPREANERRALLAKSRKILTEMHELIRGVGSDNMPDNSVRNVNDPVKSGKTSRS